MVTDAQTVPRFAPNAVKNVRTVLMESSAKAADFVMTASVVREASVANAVCVKAVPERSVPVVTDAHNVQ